MRRQRGKRAKEIPLAAVGRGSACRSRSNVTGRAFLFVAYGEAAREKEREFPLAAVGSGAGAAARAEAPANEEAARGNEREIPLGAAQAQQRVPRLQPMRRRRGENSGRLGGRMAVWRGGAFVSLAVALAVTLEALAEWLVRRRGAARAREVLFFPSRVTCVERLLAAAEREAEEAAGGGVVVPVLPCCSCPLPHDESPFSRLLGRLLGARRSLDLCLFAFSSPQLCRAVLVLHRRGVRIRVVTDADYMALRGSQIGILRRAGIQVRHDQDSGYMHHKFAIIDKKLLLNGSLNWTTQAIQQNRENVLILEDAEYVKLFLEEFEKIWENYNPANYIFFSKEEVPKKDKHKPQTERQFKK